MATIKLTQGLIALIDDADFEWLSQWPWHAFKGCGGRMYAARNSRPDETGRRRHIFMHREIANTPVGFDTDHANGDTLDNRRDNLRVATRAENMWNRRANARGSSAAKGVYWHKMHRKWVASIQIEKKRHHLGLFGTEAEAIDAYQRAAVAAHGQFYRSAER